MNIVKLPYSDIDLLCIHTAEAIPCRAVMLTANKRIVFLEALNAGFGKFGNQIRIFGKKLLRSAPARVAGNIKHSNKSDMICRKLNFFTYGIHHFGIKSGIKGRADA